MEAILMATIARVPITNIYMGGDYTGLILVGPQQQPMNVILDTGSSALALDGTKYKPNLAGGDKTTDLAQTDSYGDGSSWVGAVIETKLTMGSGGPGVTLQGGNAAIAYTDADNMFGSADGILGLAYAPLDDAFTMPKDTWANQYTGVQVRTGTKGDIAPYLTQLANQGVVSDVISFRTRRSFVHVGGGANDPLNQGVMVIGGGQESTDLYTGAFQNVSVLSDEWYCTNLKSVTVGNGDPIISRIEGPKGMPSNSIVDSGTNSLNLGPQMLMALISKFTTAQQALLKQSILDEKLVSVQSLNLASWPTLTFVLQGDSGDVSLQITPSNYWQVNTEKVGAAMAAITKGQAGLSILGLPLMNGYFTIFDGEADNGRGVIRFATAAG
jgi:Eukaryotic aspartyl protease